VRVFNKVKFINLPEHDPLLDVVGVIVGIASRHAEMTVYIVSLPRVMNGVAAVTMTEHCLESV
jgi:hypothetical protein